MKRFIPILSALCVLFAAVCVSVPVQASGVSHTEHQWSGGSCVICGSEFPLNIRTCSAVCRTNQAAVPARAAPYRSGEIMFTYAAENSAVTVNAKAYNSAGNLWYRTTEGYWIDAAYLDNATLTGVRLSWNGTASCTFQNGMEFVTPQITLMPSNALITEESWTSSNPKTVSVSEDGVIRPVAAGRAVVRYTVKSGNRMYSAALNVIVPKSAALESWTYDNHKYNHDLALECAEYMALAYPYVDYETDSAGRLLIVSKTTEDTMPRNLTRLLQSRGYAYSVSGNYENQTQENCAYVLAHKRVSYRGISTPLVWVIIQGTGNTDGWEGNFMVSGTSYHDRLTDHATFRSAADDIKSGLQAYVKQFGSEKPLVVVTGHSRGASVANLLAEDLNHMDSLAAVYAYTFATPNAARIPVNSDNIFNICNTGDFVPYMPFSSDGWAYGKHGITYAFDAAQLYKTSTLFRQIINAEMTRSDQFARKKPDYSWALRTPVSMKEYITGKWKTLSDYYQHTGKNQFGSYYDMEAYDYFMQGLAQAAGEGNVGVLLKHLHPGCVYTPVSWFFAGNGIAASPVAALAAFADSHQSCTYHAALLSATEDAWTDAYLFSADASLSASDAASVTALSEVNAASMTALSEVNAASVPLDSAEFELLHSFFTAQASVQLGAEDETEFVDIDNAEMLREAGWDPENADTWSGVVRNAQGHVTELDLRYMNLGGWLSVSGLSELRTLNVDGNFLTMLGTADCTKLESISCFGNQLGALSVGDCAALKNLDCACNALEQLDVSGLEQLQELNCAGNALSSLNLNGTTALEILRCGNNQLAQLDLTDHDALSELYCEGNLLDVSTDDGLSKSIAAIEESGGVTETGYQQQISGYAFNDPECSALIAFAGQADNAAVLAWNDDPWNWQGVAWDIRENMYHVISVELNAFPVSGTLDLSGMEYLQSVSCDNTGLSELYLTDCPALETVSCNYAALTTLDISDCPALTDLHCTGNYLGTEEIGALNRLGLQTGISTEQKIDADSGAFDTEEYTILWNFAEENALDWDTDRPGTWYGVEWISGEDDGKYHVRGLDLSDLPVSGRLDLSAFAYLEEISFRGTELDTVTLPESIVILPEYAFAQSAVRCVNLPETLTGISTGSFQYCENLETIVIPAKTVRLADRIFYGCKNLRNVIFTGSEPSRIGTEIFTDTAPERVVYIPDGNAWNPDSAILTDSAYQILTDDLVILPGNLSLSADNVYNAANPYGGTDITVSVMTKTSGVRRNCMLAVYNDSGIVTRLDSRSVELSANRTDIVFPAVNLQYACEESCRVKVFLTDENGRPCAEPAEISLYKTVS